MLANSFCRDLDAADSSNKCIGRLRAGIGTAGNGPTIAIIVHATGVDLEATPRAVAVRGGFDLVATIDPRVESPQLTIAARGGVYCSRKGARRLFDQLTCPDEVTPAR